jgi:hypothetical protein
MLDWSQLGVDVIEKDKSPTPGRIQNPDCPGGSLVPILTMIYMQGMANKSCRMVKRVPKITKCLALLENFQEWCFGVYLIIKASVFQAQCSVDV